MRNWTFHLANLGVLAITSAAGAVEQASVTLNLDQSTLSGPVYNYNLVLNNTGTTTVGTFWYAWIPGQDYLATRPITVTNPTGWTSTITGGGTNDGFAIQWKATSAASDVASGGTLGGFSFTTTDNFNSVSGNSAFFPTTPVSTSFVYSGTPFSDSGFRFNVNNVPEPMWLGVLPGLAVLRRRRG